MSPCSSESSLRTTVLLATAFLMTITRLTSGEAVRAVVSGDLETVGGLETCDQVEAALAEWEAEVGGLVAARLRLGGGAEWAKQERWAEARLDSYYTVRREITRTFVMFSYRDGHGRGGVSGDHGARQ